MFCIDKALSFIIDDENLKLAAQWLRDGKVTINGLELKSNLTPDQKYAIIKLIYSSRGFTGEEKNELRTKTFEGDASDKAHSAQKVCDNSFPTAELKAQIWTQLTDLTSDISVLNF